MSANLIKNKSNHIRYLNKDIDNSDIDPKINKELRQQNKKTIKKNERTNEKILK